MANTSADSTGTAMPEDKVKEQKAIAKKDLKEGIVAMAVLKRADKGRYGNLQISMKTLYFPGKKKLPKYHPGRVTSVK